MGRATKIDWCDSTWNPATGCLHGCAYCYAARIAERFGGLPPDSDCHVQEELNRKLNGKLDPYPFGFAPTFHRYLLDKPKHWKKSRNIFVCSMADLFGEWVPDEWIRQVIEACEDAPQHNYIFLTKNPSRYDDVNKFFRYDQDDYLERGQLQPAFMFGASASNNRQIKLAYHSDAEWISIEPIQEEIDDFWMFSDNIWDEVERPRWDWVVVGAETGNRKEKVIPKKEWIMKIADACKGVRTPVFMKESLRPIMGSDFKQQYPWWLENGNM